MLKVKLNTRDLNTETIGISLPVGQDFTMGLNQEQLVKRDFVDREMAKVINPIVDLEKVVYTPCYTTEMYQEGVVYQSLNNDGQVGKLKDIDTLQFNFHFRDRFKYTESGGQVTEKWYEFTDNWLTQDGVYWNGYMLGGGKLTPRDNGVLVSKDGDNQSDLLGYLGFTTDDVRYQKDKIRKTFVRLSFYDSPDPRHQKLLYYSTIFMNSAELFEKFANNLFTTGYIDIFYPERTGVTTCGVNHEYNPGENEATPPTSGFTLDETKRLSSRIEVQDKYNSMSSSEGFYLYLFKEDSPKIMARSIYMKVEFNHAGNGRTIPFMMPVDNSYKPIPIESSNFPYKGFMKNDGSGIDMLAYYKALFIEVKIVYDAPTGRYLYFLPQGMGEKKDRTLVFNLFEAKVQ
jgi:hypothetical protein